MISTVAAMSSRTLVRNVSTSQQLLQKRTFIDWMTHYPDRINELKKLHQAGGRAVFTWLKQPGDATVSGIAAFLMTIGLVQLTSGFYKLATGKGKMD